MLLESSIGLAVDSGLGALALCFVLTVLTTDEAAGEVDTVSSPKSKLLDFLFLPTELNKEHIIYRVEN